MVLVLDSNEYIFAFGLFRKESCKELIKVIRDKYPEHIIRIPRLIVEEVGRHLIPEAFREFVEFLSTLTTIDEDRLVPFKLSAKYEAIGFKPPDAFIVAYTEWVGADALVTENLHFLSRQSAVPFKVLTAEKCLQIIK